MPTKISSFLTIIVALFLFSSCGNDNSKVPDVSTVKVSLQTFRFDQDIYAIDTNHISEGLTKLHQKYPDFLDCFLDTVMPYAVHGNYADTNRGVKEGVREYLTFPDYQHLRDSIKHYYPDTKDVDAQLTEAYKLMKYYLPATIIPRIMYINCILQNRIPVIAIDSTTSCISLDMFLGPQCPYYSAVSIPAYMGPHLRKSYIPVAFFRNTYQTAHEFKTQDRTLLDLMIERGKEQYFLHKIMPSTPDSVLFGFTGLQLTFCEKNEAELYNYFIQNELLYNKQEMTVTQYVVDGPFAKGIGSPTDEKNTTPGNIGSWMGYRIIASYMAQNSKVSLKDLLDNKVEAAKILEAAHYKPKS